MLGPKRDDEETPKPPYENKGKGKTPRPAPIVNWEAVKAVDPLVESLAAPLRMMITTRKKELHKRCNKGCEECHGQAWALPFVDDGIVYSAAKAVADIMRLAGLDRIPVGAINQCLDKIGMPRTDGLWLTHLNNHLTRILGLKPILPHVTEARVGAGYYRPPRKPPAAERVDVGLPWRAGAAGGGGDG